MKHGKAVHEFRPPPSPSPRNTTVMAVKRHRLSRPVPSDERLPAQQVNDQLLGDLYARGGGNRSPSAERMTFF